MRCPLLSPASLWAILFHRAPGTYANHGSVHTSVGVSTEVCESRTINYITDTLPQLCLPTAWSAANPTAHGSAMSATETSSSAATAETATATATQSTHGNATSVDNTPYSDASTGLDAPKDKQVAHAEVTASRQELEDAEDLATGSFMSFDEWKNMMLKKSGQDLADLRDRKRREARDADPNVGSGLDGWGEDGEISLDFDVLSGKISEMTATGNLRSGTASTDSPIAEMQDTTVYDDGVAHYRRPKDAGKTCKERFSYSSFDGGATVLKTSPGTQNAKAILIENKDSYMLFTCSQENKFVIVELSEDILVDTVVLANFEFFSSMIRSFRVSVSDKYPVKMEKWKDLGTFQARNSRDIQSFLIENPKIWAKYIRIEFLSHYGNEYYCPVSLLRVHGTRMLDSWKDAEAGLEDDEPAETVTGSEAVPEQDPTQDDMLEAQPEHTHVAERSAPAALQESFRACGLSPWYPPLFNNSSSETCGISTPTITETIESSPSPLGLDGSLVSSRSASSTEDVGGLTIGNLTAAATVASTASLSSSSSADTPLNISVSSTPSAQTSGGTGVAANTTQIIQQPVQAASSRSSVTPPRPSASSKIPHSHSSKSATRQSAVARASSQPSKTNSQNRNTTSTSSSPPASPAVQESFFKSVSKRLQFLESNTTLSLQYIEEQSKFLQEALKKMERKQISRVDSFLDNLNTTVFSELRRLRQDYDQIWQSTVIALETQREQSQRDILALRDEVIFQKRMAIFQSILLLCCLVLVVFSRGVFGGGGGGGGADQWPISSTSQFLNSYIGSPRWPPISPRTVSNSNTPIRNGNSALQPARAQTPAPRHGAARRDVSYTDKTLPLTPTSEGFGSNGNTTPTPPRPPVQAAAINRNKDLTLDKDFFANEGHEPVSDEASTATPRAPKPAKGDTVSSVVIEVGDHDIDHERR